MFCRPTIEAIYSLTDRHEASRGLFATAEQSCLFKNTTKSAAKACDSVTSSTKHLLTGKQMRL